MVTPRSPTIDRNCGARGKRRSVSHILTDSKLHFRRDATSSRVRPRRSLANRNRAPKVFSVLGVDREPHLLNDRYR